jgi:putative membrane protein
MSLDATSSLRRRNSWPAGLIGLYLFTLASVSGFAVFGLHPERLAGLSASALEFYSVSFRFFAVGQVMLAGIIMVAFLIRHARLAWLNAFVALYAISLTSELLGTTFGIPFGAYSYSAVLAPMWLDRVPVGIPLSWFYMAVPSYAIATWLLGTLAPVRRIALGSFILLAWDLALDPAMSSATKYWEWGEAGPYYGMPLLNLFGWYVTGVVLMGALAALKSDKWIVRLPVPWLSAFYMANLLLAIGMCAAAGLWIAVTFTIAALSITVIGASILGSRDIKITSPDPALHIAR